MKTLAPVLNPTPSREAADMFSEKPRVPITVSLRRLLPSVSFVGCADIYVTAITDRSGECGPRTVFAAIPGTKTNGVEFVPEAVERGAAALLLERPLCGVALPQCVVPNARKAYAEICAALAAHPSQRLKLTGVTGTNGKTTVTWLIRSILQAEGKRTGLLGTIEYSNGWESVLSGLTTPDSKTLSHWLSSMVSCGTEYAAIELSSHALDQDRAAGASLDVAVVTNITRDHFDYHQGFDAYRASKARILNLRKRDGRVVLSADDPGSASLMEWLNEDRPPITFGLERPADVTAVVFEESLAGSRFILDYCGATIEVTTRLIGRHNVLNCLAAAAAATEMGASLESVAAGIGMLTAVPGRLERVDCGQPYNVFVDYAHTDDALQRCVDFLRSLGAGRVICVFGAGGDRDREKRPLLGRAAAAADLAVVTSDNPRSEDPRAIIDDILKGFPESSAPAHVEPDRAAAIGWALQQARPGDCVLVAGKGHETEQIVGPERHPFDDREVVRTVLGEDRPAAGRNCRKVSA
jgi:UDP-N-acetylmuramoyl-L-alanyl-D-glutamate--2,6-diaminopimelate ligase